MAIIMRSSGQKRDQGDKRKQIYTWVGCSLVMILTLISVIPNMGSEQKAPDYSKFSSSRMQDLAALPFGTDAEAGNFLRGNSEYEGISNEELLGSLFSSEDRKERQAKDKAEGVPPPPDPEYKEIAKQKEKAEEIKTIQEARIQRQKQERETFNKNKEKLTQKEKARAEKIAKQKAQVRNQNAKTTPQTLAGGSRAGSSSGGSTGVTGSIWRYEGKDVKNGAGADGTANHALNAQDMAFARDKGRNVGLDVAAIESLTGANAESADAAAAGAIDAFQGEMDAEDLDQDEQELGLDELPEGVDVGLQDDLERSIGEQVNKQEAERAKSSGTANGKEYSINEYCIDSNGKFNLSCFGMQVGMKALDAGINCVTSGCWTSWKGSGSSGSFTAEGDYAFIDGATYYKGACIKGC